MENKNKFPLERTSLIRAEDERKIERYAKELESSNLVEELKVLFNILTKLDYLNKQLFPNLSETKKKYNNLKGGERIMSGLTREIYLDGYASGEKRGEEKGKEIGILDGKAEGILAGMKDLLIEMYNNNMVTKEYASNKLNITEEEFLELVK